MGCEAGTHGGREVLLLGGSASAPGGCICGVLRGREAVVLGSQRPLDALHSFGVSGRYSQGKRKCYSWGSRHLLPGASAFPGDQLPWVGARHSEVVLHIRGLSPRASKECLQGIVPQAPGLLALLLG
jgi:hypothetical protein